MIEAVVFYGLGGLIVLASLAAVTLKKPLTSVLSFLVLVLLLAVLYLLLEATFLAAVQVVIYAGAVAVIFLFVVLLIGLRRKEEKKIGFFYGLIALMAALGLAGLLGLILHAGAQGGALPAAVSQDPKALGQVLFSEFLLPLELAGLLIFTAAAGAVLMTRRTP